MKKPHVFAEGEWIPLDSVKFLDIEEDYTGRDLVTFEYKAKQYKSFVIEKF